MTKRQLTAAEADEIARLVREHCAPGPGPAVTLIVGVDGRSASGKTTLAAGLARALGSATVVHTDDIAWWHSHFDWVDVLTADVLAPLRAGRPVAQYRPPGWILKDRKGSLNYPVPREAVIVEGVGSTQLRMRPFLDFAIWVEWDQADARRRGLARDAERFGSAAEALADWEDWQAAEVPFLEADRPWERADLIVRGGEA